MGSRPHYARLFIVLMAILLTGCAAAKQPAVDQQGPVLEAKADLDELLELMQKNSMNRLTIDWDDFRAKVLAQAAGAKTVADTRPAIREALRLLGDNHSSYRSWAGSWISVAACPNPPASTGPISLPELPSTVGYIKVGGFSGSSDEAAAFADSIQQTIKECDGQGVTGWLVDLRGNTGGNMWPMLSGLSPILGEGTLGYFIDPTGDRVLWEVRDGGVYYNGFPMQNKATRKIGHEASRVAVLTGAATASSGEAVVISFRGRSDTRSFGTATCGLSTANRSLPLSDGGTLNLTVSVMADRTGTPYGGPVVPDEVIEDPALVAERAIEWLLTGK